MYIHPARNLYEGRSPFLDAATSFLTSTLIFSPNKAATLLLKHGVHRIALLDRAGEAETMVGIITQFQVLKYIAANVRWPALNSVM